MDENMKKVEAIKVSDAQYLELEKEAADENWLTKQNEYVNAKKDERATEQMSKKAEDKAAKRGKDKAPAGDKPNLNKRPLDSNSEERPSKILKDDNGDKGDKKK